MKMSNRTVAILPYEPQVHASTVYRWAHSGSYGMLFDNLPLLTIADCMRLREAFVAVNPANYAEVYGLAVLHNRDERNRRVEIHGMIAVEHQSKGLAKEAMKFIVYYVMNNMNFYKVIALIRDGNAAADKATRDFGFVLEAPLKQHIYVDGEFHDMRQYYMTKGMFNKRYKAAIEAEARGETP